MGRPSRESLRLLREAREERIRIARQDVNAFIEYVGVDDSDRARKSNGGRVVRMKQHGIHEEMQRLIDRHRKLVLMTSPETGKALARDTKIPVPAGWSTMADLVVGDIVFDSGGQECTVIAKSPIFIGHKVYRVTLTDGTEILADEGHLWHVSHDGVQSVVNTGYLAENPGYSIPWAEPINTHIHSGYFPGKHPREVVSVEPVPSVPVQCITVDSPDSSYIVGREYVVTHNSSNIALRLLWEIGRNPDIRILIASKNKNPEGTGAKAVKQLRSYIQTSKEFHEVFPEIRPAMPWKEKIFCVKRKTQARESTVQLGSFGDYVKGSRFNIIFLDDWYDEQSAASPTDRNKLMRWIETLQDRLLDDGRMIVCCNAIHPDDPAHRIERLALEKPHKYTWRVKRFPVYEPPDYDIDLDEVRPVNPIFWPIRRIRDMKNSMSELEFRRLYLCSAIDESGSAFHHETVARAFRPENEPGGSGDTESREMSLRTQRETGCQVVVGVDFGAKQHARADKTVLTAVAYYPRTDTRQVLWIESGRWRSDVVAQKIVEFDRRFRPATMMLETSGQQEMIFGTIDLQMKLYERDADPDEPVPYPPCQGYSTTAANKWSKVSGVEMISSQISAGRWVFPAIHSDGKSPIHGELAQLKAGMVGYVRGQHTADHLMSLWLANEGIRMIAYSEDEDREERETERAMTRLDDLFLRHRPPNLPDDFMPVDIPEYLRLWEALEEIGVDMEPFEDDYYALTGLLEELEESVRSDEDDDPFVGITMGG